MAAETTMQDSSKLFRLDRRAVVLGALATGLGGRGSRAQAQDFQEFVRGLWPKAQAAGVSREVFDAATLDLVPEPAVLAKPKAQSEFIVSIPTYVAGAVTQGRVERGRALVREFDRVLGDLKSRSGVPGEIAIAILAVESNFGTATGGADVLRVLATLAWKGHMADKLTEEFVAALLMLQRGVARGRLKGSWAGAMGMPQFMPSAYLKYAVSYSREGAPDIWTSRADALASITNFLRDSGWDPALPWGVETRVPAGFDFADFDMDFSRFSALGFAQANGAPLPGRGAASLYMPAGAAGPAFLITDNFEVIRQYNTSDAYALAVCILADRIAGRPVPARPWPKVEPLTTSQCAAMQEALTRLGFYRGTIDGKLGRASRNAVHAFQISAGLAPADGFATKAVLDRLLAGQ
jgi:membrane-bound lytic murein transglycosylase B